MARVCHSFPNPQRQGCLPTPIVAERLALQPIPIRQTIAESISTPVTPAWLIVTYFLHTCGELCLSPVGLSSMTKLAPDNRVGQMMGIWFVAAALGNLFAGLLAGQLETLAPDSLFWTVAMITGGGGVVALLASPFVQRLMGDVE